MACGKRGRLGLDHVSIWLKRTVKMWQLWLSYLYSWEKGEIFIYDCQRWRCLILVQTKLWRLNFLLSAVIVFLWTMLEALPSSLPIYHYNRGGGWSGGGGFKNSWYTQHNYFVYAATMSSQIPDHLNPASLYYWSEHQSLQWKQLLLLWSSPKFSPPPHFSFGGLWLYL